MKLSPILLATVETIEFRCRFYSACVRAKGNQRHATMLWNLADYFTDECEALWSILASVCPESFDDPSDFNSIRFEYLERPYVDHDHVARESAESRLMAVCGW